MKRTCSILLATTALLAAGSASAQDDPFDLGTLILSGGLVPIAEGDFQRSFTVVNSETIEDKGFDTVLDVLRTVPGFQPSVGGVNAFRIRGAQSNHALVLVDGVEVQLAGSGDYELGNIPVSNIERVEVLRGPQSAVYGANAASGVINIVTKGADGVAGTSGGVSAEFGGPSGLRALNLSFRQQSERGFVSLSFDQRRTEDFDIANDVGGTNDVFEAKSVTVKGEYDISDLFTVGVVVRGLDRSEGYDDNPWPFDATSAKEEYVVDGTSSRVDDEIGGAIYLRGESANGRVSGELRYSSVSADRTFVTPFGDFAQTSGRDQWRASLSYGIDGATDVADHLATLVLEQETETFENASFAGERDVQSIAAEYRGRLSNGIDLQLGVRHDKNSAFEDATTWNGAIGYEVRPGTTLRLSGGKGIVNPTFFEQFGFSGTFVGNPDLEPETLTGWDIGLDHELANGRGVLSFTYFDQDIENNISSETDGANTTAVNVAGTSTQKGVEFAAQYAATDALSFDVSYTYTDAKDPTSLRSARVAENQLSLGARLETFGGKGDVWAQVNYVSGIMDTDYRDFSSVELDAYTLVNLGANYQLSDNAELYGRVDNVFGETYEEQWGYTRSDRVVAVGFRTTF